MIASIVFASVLLTGFLDDEDFSLSLPRGVQAEKHRVSFETDSYVLTERGYSSPLMTIVVGGGSYDLRDFHKVCLNGRQAWRKEILSSGSVVFDWRGTNAVAVFYSNLTKARLGRAKAILQAIRVKIGARCH
jgi:hypothetical protein